VPLWAGVQHPWTSYQVLLPLILGIVGTLGFFYYEAKFAKHPVVPGFSLSYVSVFIHGVVSTAVIYYLPIYFQGTKMQGPVDSGVSLFGNAFTIAPGAIVCGVTTAIFNIYRPQNLLGWILSGVGIGLLSLLKIDTPKATWVGYQIVDGFGLGILFAAPTFPVLAPLPITETAHALALFTFVRSYAQTWGVTIGGTILQNELKKKLPSSFLAMFPADGVQISYAVIPTIPDLPEPLRTQVRVAFASSLREIWIVMAALCVAGAACVFGMKEIKMHEVTDEDWGLAHKEHSPVQRDVEKAQGSQAERGMVNPPGSA